MKNILRTTRRALFISLPLFGLAVGCGSQSGDSSNVKVTDTKTEPNVNRPSSTKTDDDTLPMPREVKPAGMKDTSVEPVKKDNPYMTGAKIETPQPTGGFVFPNTDDGRKLAEWLTPKEPIFSASDKPGGPQPKTRNPPKFLTAIDGPFTSAFVAPPQQVLPPRTPATPTPTPERLPNDFAAVDPTPPNKPAMPVEPLIKTPGTDFRRPGPQTPIAQQLKNRASLDDATAEISANGVIGIPKIPSREGPIPPEKIGLPDPFENAEGAKILSKPVDDLNRQLQPAPIPKAPPIPMGK